MQTQLVFYPIVWVRATRFRELMNLTLDQYNEMLGKWKQWDLKKIIKKKSKHTYVNLIAYNEWVEDDQAK